MRDSALRKGEWFVKDKVEIVGMMRTNGRPLNDRSSIYVCYKNLNHGALDYALNHEIYRVSLGDLQDIFKGCA